MKTKDSSTGVFLFAALIVSILVMIYLVITTPSDAELTIHDYASENQISSTEYPDTLIALMERNPEAADFVLNYPFRQELTIDMNDFDRTRSVPLMLQWDERWGYLQYGNDFAANTACGPLCLSMVGWYLTGDTKFAPDQVMAFAEQNDYYAKNNGTKWTLISEGAAQLGLRVKELPLVEQKIMTYLRSGGILIAIMGPGDFTTTGHYIVVTGLQDGLLCINDPNSRINSAKLWPYETFANQVRNLWLIQV